LPLESQENFDGASLAFAAERLNAFLITPTHSIFPKLLVLFNKIILIILGEAEEL
jgi:hypothetical protein